jgi:hypothetical protein
MVVSLLFFQENNLLVPDPCTHLTASMTLKTRLEVTITKQCFTIPKCVLYSIQKSGLHLKSSYSLTMVLVLERSVLH